MAWHWLGDRPLSEPMVVTLLMHICITWPQWVNSVSPGHQQPLTVWGKQVHIFHKNWTLTLLVLRTKCFRKARSIPWVLMPWPFLSLDHYQYWHWLFKINKPSIKIGLELFWCWHQNILAIDALALCITRTSAATSLTMYNKRSLSPMTKYFYYLGCLVAKK